MMTYIGIIIIVIATACDAERDRGVHRAAPWWRWHIVKWAAFFPPLITLLVAFVPWQWWAALAVACRVLWRSIYHRRVDYMVSLKHPWDWVAHAALCFAVAMWRWDYAVVVGLTIEGTQIESGNWQRWDHAADIVADAVGIALAVVARHFIG